MTMDIDLPYLVSEPDHRGNPRLYVRKGKRRVRIREKRGTEAFARAYADALETLSQGAPLRKARPLVKPQSLGWLALKYFASEEFQALANDSQRNRRSVIESCLQEPRSPKAPKDLMRDCPIGDLSSAHIKMLRDRKGKKFGAANNRKKYLSSMFGWAVEEGHLPSNPARDVRRRKYATDGFHTWALDEYATFCRSHPKGTKAYLAIHLLLLLGARASDTATFGRQMVKDGFIGFVPRKTRYSRKTMSYKPVLPDLQAIIDQSPCGALTFLETEYGRPFTAKGLSNKVRQWCDEAGLPVCGAHGLRKLGATIVAELGATAAQMMAIFDWSDPRQAEPYIRAANRKLMTAKGLPLIAQGIGMKDEQDLSHSDDPVCLTPIKSNA